MSLVKLSLIFLVFNCLISIIAAILSAAPETFCGRTAIRKAKIKGGLEAHEGEFPWLVSIRFDSGNPRDEPVHLCGGALLNNKFVLTAAHCLINRREIYINVMAGEYDVKGRSNYEQIRGVKKFYLHEQYGTKDSLNDIALVELTKDVDWTPYVRPICLPDSSDDGGQNSLDSQMMTVAGWGSTQGNSNGEDKAFVLQKVNVPVVSLHTCQKWYEQGTDKFAELRRISLSETSHLCAGYEQGKKDSCQGDSGGPLFKRDGSGRAVVIGVVSTGKGCGEPKLPGVYTRIVNYIPWIRSRLSLSGVNIA